MEKSKFKNFTFWIAVLPFTFYLLPLYAMDVDLWNLPLAANTKIVYKDQKAELNRIPVNVTHLRSQLNSQELANFYEQTLINQGWEFKEEAANGTVSVFIKGNKFMYVVIQEQASFCDTYLISSSADLAICKIIQDYFFKETLIEDAPGNDLFDIPRYPGSRRRINIFAPEEGDLLLYEAEAGQEQISKFFRHTLKSQGWEEPGPEALAELRGLPGIKVLFFEKDNQGLFINIFAPPPGFPSETKAKTRNLISIIKQPVEE